MGYRRKIERFPLKPGKRSRNCANDPFPETKRLLAAEGGRDLLYAGVRLKTGPGGGHTGPLQPE